MAEKIRHSQAVQKWTKPQGNQVKTNCDAAVSSITNTTRLGGLIKDASSEVLVSFCSSCSYALKPEIVEALALRKAISISWDLGISNVMFEGDYL